MITTKTVMDWYRGQNDYAITFKPDSTGTDIYTAWDIRERPITRLNEFLSHQHAVAWLYTHVNGLEIFFTKGKGIDIYI